MMYKRCIHVRCLCDILLCDLTWYGLFCVFYAHELYISVWLYVHDGEDHQNLRSIFRGMYDLTWCTMYTWCCFIVWPVPIVLHLFLLRTGILVSTRSFFTHAEDSQLSPLKFRVCMYDGWCFLFVFDAPEPMQQQYVWQYFLGEHRQDIRSIVRACTGVPPRVYVWYDRVRPGFSLLLTRVVSLQCLQLIKKNPASTFRVTQ